MELDGKVAVITGGASGIGQATARRFIQEGARIGLVDRNGGALKQTAEALRQEEEGAVLPMKADIAEAADIQQVYTTVEDQWGRLDIVFAQAGINGMWAPVEKLEPEEWEETIRVNLTGTFHTVKYAVPLLKRQGGSIVVTSSVSGTRLFSTGGRSAYAVSKAGQLAFVKMMAMELAPYEIRVNAICPGTIQTKLNENIRQRDLDDVQYPVNYPEGVVPLTGGQPGQPEDVAELVLFLASDRARHITGTPVWIDGAQSLFQG